MLIIKFQIIFVLGLFFSPILIAQKNDSVSIQIENFGNSVNTSNEEYAPVISADGSLLMFTTKRASIEKKKSKEPKEILEQIWFSEKDDGSKIWQEAKALPKNINDPKRNISNIALSNDGHKLLLYVDDLTGTGDISECELKGSNWTNPQKMPEPINSAYQESSASYAPDGKTIYFVSDRPGGKGGRDIWFCKQDKDEKWGKAINLGAPVNTSEDEEAVFMHPDGKTLYFSSKRKGGIGGYDIYKTELVKNKWSAPKNIGKPINTEGDDLFFVMEANGIIAYYSSDQKGTIGAKDIFKITFNSTNKRKESGPKLALLKGVISDEKTKLPLEANIELVDNEKHEVIAKFKSNSVSGKYLISLPSGKNYGINVIAIGYLFQSENVTLPDSAVYQEITKNVSLKKLEIGTKIVLNNIFFDYDKSTIKAESKSELERLTKLLTENPDLKIEISGHTDNVGSSSYNQKLSESRAKTVVDFLISQGINQDRLVYKGYGLDQPIANNDSEEGRQLNRRTEFKIVGKS